jgi:hypothetical protein
MDARQELYSTLGDAICCGDLVGHLRAWWRVVRGEIDVEARIVPAGAAVADTGVPTAPALAPTP